MPSPCTPLIQNNGTGLGSWYPKPAVPLFPSFRSEFQPTLHEQLEIPHGPYSLLMNSTYIWFSIEIIIQV
jgi:hypothetical protein